MPLAQPPGDPGLHTDQQAGEEDQPRHDRLEDPGRQADQQRGTGDGAQGADEDDRPGDRTGLAGLVAIAEDTAQAAGDQAEGVRDVGDDRRQPEGDEDREAEQGGDPDGRGQHPGTEAGRDDQDRLEQGHCVHRAVGRQRTPASNTLWSAGSRSGQPVEQASHGLSRTDVEAISVVAGGLLVLRNVLDVAVGVGEVARDLDRSVVSVVIDVLEVAALSFMGNPRVVCT